MTPFSAPSDYKKVEKESEGPGWRYFHHQNNNSRKILIYNHGWTGVRRPYFKFAGAKKANRDLNKVGIWFQKHDVNFYAALRKNGPDAYYSKSVEPLEVFYHLTEIVKEKFSDNYSICYVGHSAGGGAPLFTALFIDKPNFTHVSISPENCRDTRYDWCDHAFFEDDLRSPSQAKI